MHAKRKIITEMTRAVAHLYAIAGATAGPYEWDSTERSTELDRMVEMLTQTHSGLGSMPECAASVREQVIIVSSVKNTPLDDVAIAMALARSGLVLNTWCTAIAMQTTTRATDGPLTLGGLMQIVNNLQPDERYQTALIEKLSAVAYDNSAVRQLGTCYFQAFEAYSLLELHQIINMSDTSRAADLLDNAGRGALTAVRFFERQPIHEIPEPDESDADAKPENRDEPDAEAKPENRDEPDAEAKPEARPKNPDESDAEAKPEKPDESDAEARPENPDESDADAKPENPDESDAEAKPENPDESDAEAKPEARPEKPDESDAEAKPEKPDESDAEESDELDAVAKPQEPDKPDESDAVAKPQEPDKPDESDAEARPENPDESDAEAKPEKPDESDAEGFRGDWLRG